VPTKSDQMLVAQNWDSGMNGHLQPTSNEPFVGAGLPHHVASWHTGP